MLINCDGDLSTFLKGMLPLFPSILKVLFIFIQWNIYSFLLVLMIYFFVLSYLNIF